MREIEKVGINSFGIVVIISLFVGAVITIQVNFNIENPLLPDYLVGLTVRDSLLLEFSSTMMALVLEVILLLTESGLRHQLTGSISQKIGIARK